MSAHSINDIIGWLLFTLVIIFMKSGTLAFDKIFVLFVWTFLFVGGCLSVGRIFVGWLIGKIREKHMPEPSTSLTVICLLGLWCGAVTQHIGIHALFGFFVAGIMAGSAKGLSERTRQVISQMVYAIFVPLFFASIGLRVDFLKNFDLFLVVFISFVGVAGKFLGGFGGARMTKLSFDDQWAVAIAHVPGGMMEIVVGMIALENGLISEKIFVAIVFGAISSSVIVGPWLSYAINRRKEVSILEYFSRRSTLPDLVAVTKEEAIRELCDVAALQGEIPQSEAVSVAVLAREETMGTALEHGVAIPHARLNFLKKPVIVFGRAVTGIDWNSPDGHASHFIFLVLTPEKDLETQIQILRFVAKTMSDEKTRDRIMRAVDEEGIWNILRRSFESFRIQKHFSHRPNSRKIS